MKIVLVWVWGSWISSLAYLFLELGYTNIIWIDSESNQITTELNRYSWIKIIIWHWKYEVQNEDLVIYVDPTRNSPEVKKAYEYTKNIWNKFNKPFTFKEFTWEISKYFKTIGIAWTHWKSTTTALISKVFSDNEKDFWLGILWALVPEFNRKNYTISKRNFDDIKNIFNHIVYWKIKDLNHKNVKKYYFLIEADEYNRNFLRLDIDYLLITNIELDHSEIFWNEDNYYDAFYKLCEKVKRKIFILDSEKTTLKIFEKFESKTVVSKNIIINYKYLIWEHNKKNWSLVYRASKIITRNKKDSIIHSLENFKWLWRRSELIYKTKNWSLIFSDYGHHPTELSTVIDAFKNKYPNKNIKIIFQPHQARRIIQFRNEFKKVLQTENVTIFDLYTAREDISSLLNEFYPNQIDNIRSKTDLWNEFAKDIWSIYTEDFSEICSLIDNWWKSDIFLVFSAWDIDYKLRQNCC